MPERPSMSSSETVKDWDPKNATVAMASSTQSSASSSPLCLRLSVSRIRLWKQTHASHFTCLLPFLKKKWGLQPSRLWYNGMNVIKGRRAIEHDSWIELSWVDLSGRLCFTRRPVGHRRDALQDMMRHFGICDNCNQISTVGPRLSISGFRLPVTNAFPWPNKFPEIVHKTGHKESYNGNFVYCSKRQGYDVKARSGHSIFS